MPANLYMVDGGGTSRHIKKLYLVDSGGTARLIKKLYMVDSGGTSRLTFLYGNYFTIVAGAGGSGFNGYNRTGAPFYGSISPSATLNDGKTLLLINSGGSGPAPLNLAISGFSSNPGSSYVTSVTINGTTLLGGSAVFNYPVSSAGNTYAEWQWSNAVTPLVSGNSYPVVLITSP